MDRYLLLVNVPKYQVDGVLDISGQGIAIIFFLYQKAKSRLI
jgi:hypothetical protein